MKKITLKCRLNSKSRYRDEHQIRYPYIDRFYFEDYEKDSAIISMFAKGLIVKLYFGGTINYTAIKALLSEEKPITIFGTYKTKVILDLIAIDVDKFNINIDDEENSQLSGQP